MDGEYEGRQRASDPTEPNSTTDEVARNSARKEYLLMRDVFAQHWRAAFNPNPVYLSSSAWALFTLLWTTWKDVDDEKEQARYKKSELVQYLPEIKSVAGVKTFLDKACEAGFLQKAQVVQREGKPATKDKNGKVITQEVKEVSDDEYWLTRSTKLALDGCFDRSIEACLASAARMKPLVKP